MPRLRTSLPAAAYVALSVADSVAAARSRTSPAARRWRHVLKPALMPALTAAFLDGTRDSRLRGGSRLRAGTAAAQALSWGGDVALLGSGTRPFLTGVGSFFGAHVAYIATFAAMRGRREGHRAVGLEVPFGTWLVAAPLMSVAAGRRDPALRLPVAAYATILCGMFASSLLLDPALPGPARRTVQAGTALFLASDSVLATQRFLLAEPRPALDAVVMSTYTAGQGLIALGVAAAAGRAPLG